MNGKTWYIVDGYNLIFRSGAGASGSLEQQRVFLLNQLRKFSFSLKEPHLVTVVFDAHSQEGEERRAHFGPLEIYYSAKKQTADELILLLLERFPKRAPCYLVTSDKGLARLGKRQREVETLSTEDFFSKVSTLRNKKPVLKTLVTPPAPAVPLEALQIEEGEMERYLRLFKGEEAVEKNKKPPMESDFDRWLRLFDGKKEGNGA